MKNFVKLSFTPLDPTTMTIKEIVTIGIYRIMTMSLICIIGILVMTLATVLEKMF